MKTSPQPADRPRTGTVFLPMLLTLVLLAAISSQGAAAATTNNALAFDGFNDYVVVSNPGSFNVGSSTDFTIEAVIKTTKSNAAIFSKMGQSNVIGYQLWVFNGRLLLEWSLSQNISSQVQVNDGQCHHVAVVVDRSAQNAKLYVDGILQANVTHSRYGSNIDNTNPVYIGQERTQNSSFRFQGQMDEVAFFTTARTAAEIVASSTTELTGTEPGLLAYWKFNAGTPGGTNAGITTLSDESGNGNNGTLQNFALSGNSSNWVASTCAQQAPNEPPTANAGGPYSGDEDSAIALNDASASDPDGDSLTYNWTVDSALCSFDDASLLNPNLTCSDNGTYTATLEVSDGVNPPVLSPALVPNNLALGKPATQSEDLDEACNPTADKAVDGNTSGDYFTDCSVSHTGTLSGPTSQPWWQVDLQAVHFVSTIDIWNRTDCCSSRLSDFDVLISQDGSSWTTFHHPGAAPTTTTFTINAPARYVKVQLRGTNYLSLAEVQIWGAGTTVKVDNVAPTLGAISVDTALVPVNTAINASASFNDPGTNDTHTAAWDWGDGTSAGTVTQGAGSGSVNDSHSYSTPGVYTLKLTVTDDDGGVSDESVYQYVVVYDPSGGFVTGGGWINSPAGAYVADPSLTGKANFGFVAKYKKGANVPDGNTEFQFKAGDLNFHSSSYEWLVVAGNKAQFKGEGTINGQGSYKFMIWADDDNPDTFRIKIWGNAGVVYDNGSQQALGGGSIKVHK